MAIRPPLMPLAVVLPWSPLSEPKPPLAPGLPAAVAESFCSLLSVSGNLLWSPILPLTEPDNAKPPAS